MSLEGKRPQGHLAKCPGEGERRGRGLFPTECVGKEIFRLGDARCSRATLGMVFSHSAEQLPSVSKCLVGKERMSLSLPPVETISLWLPSLFTMLSSPSLRDRRMPAASGEATKRAGEQGWEGAAGSWWQWVVPSWGLLTAQRYQRTGDLGRDHRIRVDAHRRLFCCIRKARAGVTDDGFDAS